MCLGEVNSTFAQFGILVKLFICDRTLYYTYVETIIKLLHINYYMGLYSDSDIEGITSEVP